MFGCMTLANNFLGRTINFEMSEIGVRTTWAIAPFFNYKE